MAETRTVGANVTEAWDGVPRVTAWRCNRVLAGGSAADSRALSDFQGLAASPQGATRVPSKGPIPSSQL